MTLISAGTGQFLVLFDSSEHLLRIIADCERAASFYNVIETCKLNGIEPFAYLCDILEKLPTWPNKRRHELLPWNWKNPALA